MWRYHNTILLVASLVLLIFLARAGVLELVTLAISRLGYLGVFCTGIIFVSTFTVVPAGLLLVALSQHFGLFATTLLAGLGATVGDFLIFRFLRDRVFEELKPIFMKLGVRRLADLFATPHFAWLAPVLGAIIIASPLPDEVGIGLLGATKLRTRDFVLLSFSLNTIGIALILILGWGLAG